MRYHDHMYWGDGGFPIFGVVMMVGFLLLVVLGVILLVRLMRTPTTGAGDVMFTRPVPPPRSWFPPPGADPALTELRLRYARGEVSRDEFVRMSTDLGAPPEPGPPAPPGT